MYRSRLHIRGIPVAHTICAASCATKTKMYSVPFGICVRLRCTCGLLPTEQEGALFCFTAGLIVGLVVE